MFSSVPTKPGRPSTHAWILVCVGVQAWTGGIAHADAYSWECDDLPIDADWIYLGAFCEPETWIADGRYVQRVDRDSCPDEPVGESEAFRRTLDDFIGVPTFFVEWRLETDGDRTEIVGGAPTALAAANSFGIAYTFFVARDQAKLNRDNLLPIVFVDLAPDVAHTHRLELYGDTLYIWYIDGQVVDSGKPEGAFPSDNARITWVGRSWHLPAVNSWDYIRYGTIPFEGSGDFDSDGDHDLRDFYFLHECILGVDRPVMPDGGVDPGCLWADVNADGAVDLIDFADFQILASNPP